MNVGLLAALARLRVQDMLAGAALRRFGKAAIVLGDAVGSRVL